MLTKDALLIIDNTLQEKTIPESKIDFLRSIRDLLRTKSAPYIAVHGPCPDGTVTGALLLDIFPRAAILPLDYWFINHPQLRSIANSLEWLAVGDLKPLNPSYTKQLYVDHHRTSISQLFNAHEVYFNSKGASASAVLFDATRSLFQYAPQLEELVDLTRITDTGNHPGLPPLDPPCGVESCSHDELVWLFEDANSSCVTAFEILDLIEGFRRKGVSHLNSPSIQSRIKILRKNRKIAWEAGQKNVKPADFVVVIAKDLQFDSRSLLLSALQKANIGGVSIIEEQSRKCRLSFRIRKDVQKSNKEWEKYRIDLLATSLNGGGHMAAAGAKADSVELAKEKILAWAKSLNMSVSVADLRHA